MGTLYCEGTEAGQLHQEQVKGKVSKKFRQAAHLFKSEILVLIITIHHALAYFSQPYITIVPTDYIYCLSSPSFRLPFVRMSAFYETERIYLQDSHIYECYATIIRVEEKGLVLSSTVFSPQGGGQPSDKGTIEATESGKSWSINLVKVVDRRTLLHIVERELARAHEI